MISYGVRLAATPLDGGWLGLAAVFPTGYEESRVPAAVRPGSPQEEAIVMRAILPVEHAAAGGSLARKPYIIASKLLMGAELDDDERRMAGEYASMAERDLLAAMRYDTVPRHVPLSIPLPARMSDDALCVRRVLVNEHSP